MLARIASFMFLAGVGICGTVTALAADVLHQWVQLGPDNTIIVRAISTTPDCPMIEVDGQFFAMAKRAEPSDAFEESVCEHRAPIATESLSLNGNPLPILRPNAERIIVLGDTGCRIRGSRVQDCNDPAAWPLKSIVEEIVSKSPDLVIHVGDYLYRSSECPDPEKCGGSPFGDNYKAWSADWLEPADKLLTTVPFIFLRGNHENCGRGDNGWFRYFASGSVPANCPAVTDPWSASVGDLDFVSFDSSAGPAPLSSPDLLPVYGQMARDVFASTSNETWLLTHRPLWVNMHAFGELIDGDDTQREAFGAIIPETVSLILSGHIHAFQAIDLLHGPVQGIVGNSGTQLDPMPSGIANDVEVAGSLARTIVNNGEFGFLMLNRQPDGGWLIDAIDAKGLVLNRCELAKRSLSCE